MHHELLHISIALSLYIYIYIYEEELGSWVAKWRAGSEKDPLRAVLSALSARFLGPVCTLSALSALSLDTAVFIEYIVLVCLERSAQSPY